MDELDALMNPTPEQTAEREAELARRRAALDAQIQALGCVDLADLVATQRKFYNDCGLSLPGTPGCSRREVSEAWRLRHWKIWRKRNPAPVTAEG